MYIFTTYAHIHTHTQCNQYRCADTCIERCVYFVVCGQRGGQTVSTSVKLQALAERAHFRVGILRLGDSVALADGRTFVLYILFLQNE